MENRKEYFITQEKENEVYNKLVLDIEITSFNKFKINPNDTLILNVSPDYSSIISQKLSHHFSSKEGEIIDVLNINVPYPDETDMEWYNTKIDLLLKELSDIDYTNFIFVEAGIIRGSNYKWIEDKFTKQYNRDKLLFCALFENINSKFKSDCVGEYYNNNLEDLTFYWERFNKHFK